MIRVACWREGRLTLFRATAGLSLPSGGASIIVRVVGEGPGACRRRGSRWNGSDRLFPASPSRDRRRTSKDDIRASRDRRGGRAEVLIAGWVVVPMDA